MAGLLRSEIRVTDKMENIFLTGPELRLSRVATDELYGPYADEIGPAQG